MYKQKRNVFAGGHWALNWESPTDGATTQCVPNIETPEWKLRS